MAGGIRFNANGRVFSKRGLNFVNDDGTCAPCDCDNPPGSGKNTQSCPDCPPGPFGTGPVSVLLSFDGATTNIVCSNPISPGFQIGSPTSATTGGTLGSYCLNVPVCRGSSGSFPNSSEHSNVFLWDCASTPNRLGEFTIFVATRSDVIYPGWGRWEVYVSFGQNLLFHGVSDPSDCILSVTIGNDVPLPIGGNFTYPGFGPNAFRAFGHGGNVTLTPQFYFCS